MFDSLKKKLSLFKKKAEERLPEDVEGEVEEMEPAKPSTTKAKKERPPEAVKEKSRRGLFGEGTRKVNEEALEELLWDLEVELMEADVALEVVEEIKSGVKNSLSGSKISRRSNLGDVVTDALREAVGGVLNQNEFDFDEFVTSRDKPVVVMFVGINGTGKTTAIAKVANRLIHREISCVLSASDTFRAGAIEQLSIHGDKLGCKVIKHKAGGDPAAVAYDAIEHAKARGKDVVLVDTAGRMQTNINLMDEMKKIKRVAKPDLVLFVGDSLAGNDAIEQARAFNAAVGIDAVILTKIDADSRGGAALSIAYTVGKPLAFLSTGQEYDQFVKYDPKWMIERIFS
jgi:fused signal recognition particle receptor